MPISSIVNPTFVFPALLPAVPCEIGIDCLAADIPLAGNGIDPVSGQHRSMCFMDDAQTALAQTRMACQRTSGQRLRSLVEQLTPTRCVSIPTMVGSAEHYVLSTSETIPVSVPDVITAHDREIALKALLENPYETSWEIEAGPKEIEGPVMPIQREGTDAIFDEAMLFYSYLRGNPEQGIAQSYALAADLLFTSRDLEHAMALLECEVGGERLIPDAVMDYYWPLLLAHTTELSLAMAFMIETMPAVEVSMKAGWLVAVLERMPNPETNRVQRTAQILNALVEQGQQELVNACFGIAYDLNHTAFLPGRDMTLIRAHALLYIAYGETRYVDPTDIRPEWKGSFVTCEKKNGEAQGLVAQKKPSSLGRLLKSQKAKAFIDHVRHEQRRYFTQKAQEALGTLLSESRSYLSLQSLNRLLMNAEQYVNDSKERSNLVQVLRADANNLGLKIVFSENGFIIGHPDENGTLNAQIEAEPAIVSDVDSLARAVSAEANMPRDVRYGYINQIRRAVAQENFSLTETLLLTAYQNAGWAIDRVAGALSADELSQIFSNSTAPRLAGFLTRALGISESQEQSYEQTDQTAMTRRLQIIMPAIAQMPLQDEAQDRVLSLEALLQYLLADKRGVALGITLITSFLYTGHEGSLRLETAYERVREGQPWYGFYQVLVSGKITPSESTALKRGASLEDRVLVLLEQIMVLNNEVRNVIMYTPPYVVATPLPVHLKALDRLYAILRKERVPLELKALCAKILVATLQAIHRVDEEIFETHSLPWIEAEIDPPPEHNEAIVRVARADVHKRDKELKNAEIQLSTRIQTMLGELTGLFDGELGQWVDYFALPEHQVVTQIVWIESRFTAYNPHQGVTSKWRGTRKDENDFDALIQLINQHDQNSWKALQALLQCIRVAEIPDEFVRGRFEHLDLSGMILRGIDFSLLEGRPVVSARMAQQIYDGHGSFFGINFENQDMSGLDIPGAVFDHVRLTGTSWKGADLSEARFTEISTDGFSLESLSGVDLRGARLPSDFRRLPTAGSLTGVEFGISFTGTIIGRAELTYILSIDEYKRPALLGVILDGADLRNMDLSGLIFREASLVDTQLAGTSFRDAYLLGARLPEKLDGVSFEKANVDRDVILWIKQQAGSLRGIVVRENIGIDLKAIDLSGKDLTGAKFYDAIMEDANLEGACLERAVFYKTDLSGARLAGAKLAGADLRGSVLPENLVGVDFRGAMIDADQLVWIYQHGGSLRGVNLREAMLEGRTDFHGADLLGASLPDELRGVTFTNVWVDAEQVRWIIEHNGSVADVRIAGSDLRQLQSQGYILRRVVNTGVDRFREVELDDPIPEGLLRIRFVEHSTDDGREVRRIFFSYL